MPSRPVGALARPMGAQSSAARIADLDAAATGAAVMMLATISAVESAMTRRSTGFLPLWPASRSASLVAESVFIGREVSQRRALQIRGALSGVTIEPRQLG